MKINHSVKCAAIAALLGSTSIVMAGDTNTFNAAVTVLSPEQTGFIIGGQVAVNGVGTGALTMARSNASMVLNGSASSALSPMSDPSGIPLGSVFGILDGVTSTAKITSSLAFDRSITTSGALVGLGAVTSRGEAIAALGSDGAASASTTTAGTRADSQISNGSSTYDIAGGEGNASADASSQGSLNGSLSTSNTLQLLGTSGLFAGSNGMFVGESNDALAYGSSTVDADGTSGVALNSATADVRGQGTNRLGSNDGALFLVTSSLTTDPTPGSTANTINMTVANAGNGSISLSTSTGGFFTGGGAAAGSSSLADTGSFFSPTPVLQP